MGLLFEQRWPFNWDLLTKDSSSPKVILKIWVIDSRYAMRSCLHVSVKCVYFSALPVEDIPRQGKGLHPLLSGSPASCWHPATVSYKPDGHKVRPHPSFCSSSSDVSEKAQRFLFWWSDTLPSCISGPRRSMKMQLDIFDSPTLAPHFLRISQN